MSTAVEVFAQGGNGLAGLALDSRGQLYTASQRNGNIYQIDEEGAMAPPYELQNPVMTRGAPSGAAFDDDNVLFIADQAHQAILSVQEGQVVEFVKEYEEEEFLGPNSVAFHKNGTMYFTDSGPLGESSLEKPCGSVYAISSDGQLLRPLAHHCLAHPAGIAVSPDGNAVYVAETLKNRLLRFIQRPNGVYHCSVFRQFSGRLGPTGVAVDKNGNIFVTLYDMALSESTPGGVVAITRPDGSDGGELDMPAPELTGIAVRHDRENTYLFVSEASTNSVYRTRIDL
eukprot:TRINITY_DN23431_c0_g1_i1.p1 TRINITY_DN23431_c0_g1~~TRINITY_DN23431_c0_g1_i1.p1  ORF type:complete len:285 (+),score=56.60 TRINITY_DN23431_c0_g1_i1:245-1099(+)